MELRAVMNAALEEIEFLALSANRTEVLSALSEESYTRHEITEQIDASQPTLGRILRDLMDRQWIEYNGEKYAATATGQLVVEEFTDLRETIEAELKLRTVIEWLPTETMEFDLRHLSNSTITIPSQTKPGAPIQRVLKLLRSSTHVKICSHAFNEQSLNVIQQRAVEDTQAFEGVFSPTAVDAIAHDSTLRQQLQDLIVSEDAKIRLHDGEIPLAVTITDDIVHLLLRDEDGFLRAALDTDEKHVLSWAHKRHNQYWQNSSSLTTESLGQ